MAVTRHEARGNAREPDGGNAGTHESKYQYLRYRKYDIANRIGKLGLRFFYTRFHKFSYIFILRPYIYTPAIYR